MRRYSLGRPLRFQSTTPPPPSPPPPPPSPSPSTPLPLPSPPSRESSPAMSLWTDFECPRPLTTDASTNTVRPATRTVGTNGIQVFLELGPRSCWRCGGEGHTRERCQGVMVKFCSRCGLMGVLSRDCCVGAPNRVRLSTDHRLSPPLRNREEAWLPDLRLRPAAPAAPTPSPTRRKKVKVD
ncbi:uncharacterized proline-rich protein-like [Coccinella septempunctata]|uniref:uncharacterized proline-rich protein-like n=1 Tax=Coccinella septempunctata TaxID=41139 RepID=UPI001D0894E9|nr:uncharacterized proline-rich protein-like [Coccinella septempunctata]